jgi:3',5'-cyclic AMP phosphodiesterase CpdA
MRLAGLGGLVIVGGGLPSWVYGADADATGAAVAAGDGAAPGFSFVQLSDTHLGFSGPKVNPDAEGTLAKAIAAVNALSIAPDFVVFTGDLTHTTDDGDERRKRLAAFKAAIAALKVKDVRLLPGEHDASLDAGQAFTEVLGVPLHGSFDHKGVHFLALDNVSDKTGIIGDAQLAWLKDDLSKQPKDARIVVLTHRPLFPLFPQWEWQTKDGQGVLDALAPFADVQVFYGHIHQEHHLVTGNVHHHSANSLMYALPVAGSVPKKAPIPWDATAPYKGLGWRDVTTAKPGVFTLDEEGVKA